MTPTPTWTINTMNRTLPDGAVTVVHWTVSLTSEDGYSSSAYGSTGLSKPDPDTFIPYDTLSQEQVISWLHELMGQEQVSAYETALVAQIAEQRTPKQAMGLPWTTSPSTPDAATPPSDDTTDVPTPLSDDPAEPLTPVAT